MGHSTEFLVLMVGPFYLLLACWQFVGLATLADLSLIHISEPTRPY